MQHHSCLAKVMFSQTGSEITCNLLLGTIKYAALTAAGNRGLCRELLIMNNLTVVIIPQKHFKF